ncbi:Uncharacterised protein [Chryseobacterium nakagawai]|nr:Uncharacterised protein [Chryseobacterium nakagawai]
MTLMSFKNNTIIIFLEKGVYNFIIGYKNKMLLIWIFQY